MNEEFIDKFFREPLSEQDPPKPSVREWQAAKMEIDAYLKKRRRRRALWFILGFGLAGILISGMWVSNMESSLNVIDSVDTPIAKIKNNAAEKTDEVLASSDEEKNILRQTPKQKDLLHSKKEATVISTQEETKDLEGDISSQSAEKNIANDEPLLDDKQRSSKEMVADNSIASKLQASVNANKTPIAERDFFDPLPGIQRLSSGLERSQPYTISTKNQTGSTKAIVPATVVSLRPGLGVSGDGYFSNDASFAGARALASLDLIVNNWVFGLNIGASGIAGDHGLTNFSLIDKSNFGTAFDIYHISTKEVYKTFSALSISRKFGRSEIGVGASANYMLTSRADVEHRFVSAYLLKQGDSSGNQYQKERHWVTDNGLNKWQFEALLKYNFNFSKRFYVFSELAYLLNSMRSNEILSNTELANRVIDLPRLRMSIGLSYYY